MIRKDDLKPEFCPEFYLNYIGLVPDVTLRSALGESEAELIEYLSLVSEERENFAYAPGKWTIKECLQHIIDTERIFAARALRIARGDQTDLPSFNQDDYVMNMNISQRSYRHMIEEFRVVREASVFLFLSLRDEDLLRVGTVDGKSISVGALGYIICGHTIHHAKLYHARYGLTGKL